MNDKGVLENQKPKERFKRLKGFQYWIAAISYLVVFSLSMVCLVSYLPHLSEAEVLDSGTLNILRAMFIIILLAGTGAFGWEMLQWRRGRAKKDERPSLEEIIKDFKKDSNNNR